MLFCQLKLWAAFNTSDDLSLIRKTLLSWLSWYCFPLVGPSLNDSKAQIWIWFFSFILAPEFLSEIEIQQFNCQDSDSMAVYIGLSLLPVTIINFGQIYLCQFLRLFISTENRQKLELILYFPKLRHTGWDPQLTSFSYDNTPQSALCPEDRVQAKRRILRSKIKAARNWWGWISAGKDETTERVAPNLCELFQTLLHLCTVRL